MDNIVIDWNLAVTIAAGMGIWGTINIVFMFVFGFINAWMGS